MKIKLLVATSFFIPALAMAQAPKIEPPVVAGTPRANGITMGGATPGATEIGTGINRKAEGPGKNLPFQGVVAKPAAAPVVVKSTPEQPKPAARGSGPAGLTCYSKSGALVTTGC